MAKHLFKMAEWQGSSGNWYCADTSDLEHDSGVWFLPARMLGISPADFLSKVINEYKPDSIYSNREGFVCFSWLKQSDMRRYKNWINKEARNRNFTIG